MASASTGSELFTGVLNMLINRTPEAAAPGAVTTPMVGLARDARPSPAEDRRSGGEGQHDVREKESSACERREHSQSSRQVVRCCIV